VYEFNPLTGTFVTQVFRIGDATGEMHYDGRYLYMADLSESGGGVMVLNPAGNTVVAGPVMPGGIVPRSFAIITTTGR
jgi:hypothetical protein